ncbi:hypothetical protein SAMN06295888_102122 [Desulfonatronum zhilinae]|nr:hypothetical protein SAMN06295888_102122 [Desulfonatronum zhilinae]
MRAYDLAVQNFSVAEHLLDLHQLFRNLRECPSDNQLHLAVCKCLDVPENTVLRHARNDQLVMVAKAASPIPASLLVQDGANFLLRQAVVVACTALESFFWDALRENVLTIVRARKRRTDDSLRKISLSLDDYLSLEGYDDPDVRLQQIILKNFERGTIYDAASIENIAKILTVKNFWAQVSEKTGNPDNDIKRHINEIIQRRNQVAHRADRPDGGSDAGIGQQETVDGHGLRVINYAWVNPRIATTKSVVSAASDIFAQTLRQLKAQLAQEDEQRLARATMRPS